MAPRLATATSFMPSAEAVEAHQKRSLSRGTQVTPGNGLPARPVVAVHWPAFCAMRQRLALSPVTRTVSPVCSVGGRVTTTVPDELEATV